MEAINVFINQGNSEILNTTHFEISHILAPTVKDTFSHLWWTCMCICVDVHVCVCVCLSVHVYVYLLHV